MPLLISYSIKNAFARKLTSTLTIFGIALVVFVFCAVLMLSNGLQQTLVDTGSDNNAVVVRKSANTEIVSILPRDMADIVKSDPGIARTEDGTPKFAGEILVLINLIKRSNNEPSNVPVRGVSDISIAIRPNVKVVEGRMWQPGTSEIIAGAKVSKNFKGCGIGEKVRFGQREWTVVGIFEAGGSGFESELWGDDDQLMSAFERPVFSSFTLQLAQGETIDELKKRLEADRRLTVDVMSEVDYYKKQSKSFTDFINILGMVISIVFSLGAIVGAMITMYASVANRTVEIGTLRALGFSQGSVLFAFLIESLSIATIGGLIGIALASFLQWMEVSTTNFDTFAEIAFPFEMSAQIAVNALIFSVVMGIVGGFLPAVSASRLRIINALRAK
ncbi:MAG: ABC transporter permease [candidate division Zixibacteria bacterium]|nr:ABC transporter permease [candidate division Zixibacteria bacterium]